MGGSPGNAQACAPYFEEKVAPNGRELRVFRCEWGWCVKSGEMTARSRYLDDAFEQILGRPLDRAAIRALVEMLDGELTAARDRTGKTASMTLPSPLADSATAG